MYFDLNGVLKVPYHSTFIRAGLIALYSALDIHVVYVSLALRSSMIYCLKLSWLNSICLLLLIDNCQTYRSNVKQSFT